MAKARFINISAPHLYGKTALIVRQSENYISVQFDDVKLTRSGAEFVPGKDEVTPDCLGFNEHTFDIYDFELIRD